MRSRNRILLLSAGLALMAVILLGSVTAALADGAAKSISNGYEYSVSDGKATITSYTGMASVLSIPGSLDGYPVTAIGYRAFDGKNITSVVIPEGITSIGHWAFFWCDDLRDITLPSSLVFIGDSAFEHCSSLASITIPAGTTRIGKSAFVYCNSLTAISVASGNTAYTSQDGVLYDISMRRLVSYPTGKAGSSFSIPSGVTKIGSHSFMGSALTSVSIPGGVTGIEDYAFAYCLNLRNLTIPSGVTSIGDGAFILCKLSSIVFPDSVKSIGNYAFDECNNLTSAVLPNNLTYLGENAFSHCDRLASIAIPGRVSRIRPSTFSTCTALTSVIIAEGVTNIDGYAFYDCESLTSITIPRSVTGFGEEAFSRCENLTICGYSGSAAQTYARNNGIPFKTITVEPLLIHNVILSKASAVAGESLTFTISATGGKAPLSYCFYVYKGSTVVYKGAYSTSNKCTYTFPSAGSYKVLAYVKDAAGTKVTRYSDVISVSSPVPLSITSVSSSKASAAAGEPATFTINAAGGQAPLSYCFYVYRGSTAVYKGAYSASNQYTYIFPSVGSYKVQGYVKDAANAKVARYSSVITVTPPAPLDIASVSCSKTSATTSESAAYTINATGGKAPYSYCFYVYKDGAAIYKGSYSSSNTYTYAFRSAGSYKVQGYVKDKYGAKVSKYSAVLRITAPAPLVIGSVSCDRTSAVTNESATFSINATGGEAPYSYCFYVFKNGAVVLKGTYNTYPVYGFRFSSAGNYKVQGYVKDANGAKASLYSSLIPVTEP